MIYNGAVLLKFQTFASMVYTAVLIKLETRNNMSPKASNNHFIFSSSKAIKTDRKKSWLIQNRQMMMLRAFVNILHASTTFFAPVFIFSLLFSFWTLVLYLLCFFPDPFSCLFVFFLSQTFFCMSVLWGLDTFIFVFPFNVYCVWALFSTDRWRMAKSIISEFQRQIREAIHK